jgi:CubicO group peptidase (beta-lactamase class C family)
MRQTRPGLASIRVLAHSFLLLAALSPEAGFAAEPDHLGALRLLPPVLVRDEKGWGIDERMRHYKVEAVSVAVFQNGRILWTEARGLADREAKQQATPQTLFQAGSISKPVAATAVLRKVESGELKLDRDVNEYLKSWKLPDSPAAAGKKVTLERILSHSAGLTIHGFPGYALGEQVPTVPQVLDGAPPANTAPVRVDLEPGTKFRYSGGGFTVAQLLMTDTFGKPFPALVRDLVLVPAGMSHSTYEQPLPDDTLRFAAAGYRRDGAAIPGKRHTYPEMAAAGLWTTSEDLARFAIAIGRSLRGEKGALLSKTMASRMTTRVIDDVGLGLFMSTAEGETYFGHDGADEGFQALLTASREHGYGVAVMVNSDNGIRLGEEIVRGIARASGWKMLPEPLTIATLAASDLDPLAGRYQFNGDEGFSLVVRGSRLVASQNTPDAFELLPLSRDVFVRKDREARYQVERAGSGGAVSGIRVVSGAEGTLAKRVGDDARLPSQDLAAGRIDEALAGYRRLFSSNPADPGIAEARLNNMGYRLAAERELGKAVAVIRLNSELYPSSSNVWDSLAEMSLATGDRARALEASRKVLEVLPSDAKTEPAVKEQLRKIAEKRIRELSP